MTAHAVVVPIKHLRRDTTGWSYCIPKAVPCSVGSLVSIPFRNQLTLGVIWEIREDEVARETIQEVLTSYPLVIASHRQLIEYLAEEGLCSLSTALYVWMPQWLRRLPLQKKVRYSLSRIPDLSESTKQQAIILPGRRPVQENLLRKKQAAILFSSEPDEYQQENWLRLRAGEIKVGIGRDAALFGAWRNLGTLTIVDPEDISYYHEQTPYISLVDVASSLARSNRIVPIWRSHLPTEVANLLFVGEARGNDVFPDKVENLDLRHQPMLNDLLIEQIKITLARGETTLILYNAYDRLSTADPTGRRKQILGVQGLRSALAKKLGLFDLPEAIVLGTRQILQQPYSSVGLTIALSVDQLLECTVFAEEVHGWSDLGHLFRYGGRHIVQSHNPEHPLIQSLVHGTWRSYLSERVLRRKAAKLPPFCKQLVLSTSVLDPEVSEKLYDSLAELLRDPWQLTHPFRGTWRKKEYLHLMLTAPLGERLPTNLRKKIVALKKPWKVQRNPWHIL